MRILLATLSYGTWHASALNWTKNGDVAKMLNDRMAWSKDGQYSGGKNQGVMVRAPDFFDNGGDDQVVPATLWHNDIFAPSQLYPTRSSPWCPNSGFDGFYNTQTCANDDFEGPWKFATVAVVMAGAMSSMFDNFDRIMEPDWEEGVFYASDANSVDARCIYRDQWSGWDCPGGWIDFDSGEFQAKDDHHGSGVYPPGNPYKKGFENGGGGSGCHFDKNANAIDQTDGFGDKGNLVQDANCQCNYDYKDDWKNWVTTWIYHSQQKPGFENRNWLDGSGTLAPSWGVDVAACWVSNPRDMIGIQNELYWQRSSWNNGYVPQTDFSSQSPDEFRKYWGWNEIPVAKWIVDDAEQWDAVIVKLPAAVCGDDFGKWGENDSPDCLSQDAKWQLENDLEQFVTQKKLVPGKDHITERPGSYILFVREKGQKFDTGSGFDLNWSREFFCFNWASPSGKYKIVYENPSSGSTCYLEQIGDVVL